MSFAHVAVSVPARVGSLFTYSFSPTLALEPGAVVMVPFASRVLPGIVVQVDDVSPGLATREVLGAVQGAPRISEERVAVASWMSGYYRASHFDCLGLFLPPGWQGAIVEEPGGEGAAPGWSFRLPQPPVSEDAAVALAPGAANFPARRATARGRVVSYLGTVGATSISTVAAEARCSPATVRRMVAEGVLVASPHPESHGGEVSGPPSGRPSGERRPSRGGTPQILLNDHQASAFIPMSSALEEGAHRVFLLHGVTGSGKTQVYLRLIESMLESGRRAIVLLSEIAQTPEALERYSERFPGRVALLHSELPDSERWQLWLGISQGRYDVVIGPRSALFAPVPQLGLVVLDEEHEPAYKQEDRAPRYHAREVAVELGRRSHGLVVLGSATPDVVSYYRAARGDYQLVSLPDRYAGPSRGGWSTGMMPRVEVVDLRAELRAGNVGVLSRSLRAGLEETLAAGEQAILFLNRRGASTCVLCRDCGHVLKCRRCDIPLVYHRESNELVCHRCNRRRVIPPRCPQCGRGRIGFFGAGTERVEEEVRQLFPTARVLRWDQDVTGKRGAHERIHRQFREHQADVLVGTQMVAKALDFPLVTLVGVILADITLHLPDLRAAERTFQLLAQVAGRAGRGEAEGRVVIQTYSPRHYSVLAASRHDYQDFYEQELDFRRHHSYPPFRRLARLLYSGTGEVRSRFEALQMLKRLQSKVDELGIGDLDLLGPAPAFRARERGRYRWQIILSGEGLAKLLPEVDLPLGWRVDVDPVSLL